MMKLNLFENKITHDDVNILNAIVNALNLNPDNIKTHYRLNKKSITTNINDNQIKFILNNNDNSINSILINNKLKTISPLQQLFINNQLNIPIQNNSNQNISNPLTFKSAEEFYNALNNFYQTIENTVMDIVKMNNNKMSFILFCYTDFTPTVELKVDNNTLFIRELENSSKWELFKNAPMDYIIEIAKYLIL